MVQLAWWLVVALGLLTALLVSLPAGWVARAAGSPELVRLLLVSATIAVLGTLHPVLVAQLPRAPVLLRTTLRLRTGGHRRRLALAEIARVDIELRPPPTFEVAMVHLRDGTALELCPVDWPGAGRLVAALLARLARRDARARSAARASS
ncbi:MAG: hypothetical protein K1X88_31785 [Nannocystaceae bacterium]|nr:hypothetical protein [Nannocystaceae bacterium]